MSRGRHLLRAMVVAELAFLGGAAGLYLAITRGAYTEGLVPRSEPEEEPELVGEEIQGGAVPWGGPECDLGVLSEPNSDSGRPGCDLGPPGA